jgi:hypothetical protein
VVRGDKRGGTFAHIELALASGRYSIAIDEGAGKWQWQTGVSDPGHAETFRIIDRGTADTYRQAVHRSTGIVLNYGDA